MDIRSQLERKQGSIKRILATNERLPGYVDLKITRVLPRLGRALVKIEEGTYGLCDGCTGKIPKKRLKVAPGATHCTPCQRIQETAYQRTAARHI